MKFNRIIKMITVVSLLLTSVVVGGLSGKPIDVFAVGLETISSGDAETFAIYLTLVPTDDSLWSWQHTVPG